MKSVSFTIIQLKVEQKNRQKNILAVENILAESAEIGDITLLPEMFSTGYIFDSAEEIHNLSEDFSHSETINSLTRMAKTYKTTLVAGIAEKENNQYYNSVAVVDENGLRYKYRKISQNRIDKQYFSRGENLLTFEFKGLKIGVAICFDIWFPELMRKYDEADVILHPANFGGQHSFAIAQARALENGQHILTCNRVGEDITNEFTASYCGGSRVYNPKGEEVVRLGDTQSSQTVVVEDLSLAPQYNGISLQEEMEEIRRILA
ncbi:carbon-nitrogen hydrolase family protein [Vibrio makurazakiensis]|uniref:carbon-nitrogen hydrolase family protein n=1 Tax=Vibrio makurazakiensis TaxID=2910250 RepID=UPI003D0C70A2